MRRFPRACLFLAVLTAAVLAAGCGDDAGSDESAAEGEVLLVDLEFEPEEITVDAGTEVTWRWTSKAMHNVTGDDFQSDNIAEGTYQHTFEEPGTYDYRCTLHPGMDGTVVVK